MVSIGTTAKKLRKSLGWTQRETADELRVSYVHLCNVENNKAQPSQALLDRYRELWGIDLYVLAWCEHDDVDELPHAVRNAASKLASAWRKQIDEMVVEHRKVKWTPKTVPLVNVESPGSTVVQERGSHGQETEAACGGV